MSRPIPPHGHSNRYAYYGCRCPECTRAASRADTERRLDRLAGRSRSIPAEPAAEHARALMNEGGLTKYQVAREAGVRPSTIERLICGQKSIYRTTAEKILSVSVQVRPSLGGVPSVGAIRRVRALYALGHFNWEIAETAGVSYQSVCFLASGAWPTLKVGMDDAVRGAYDVMSMRTGTSWKTRRLAERKGWVPPLAWDDDTIDDPAARPIVSVAADGPEYIDAVAVQRYVAGSTVVLSEAEYLAAVEELRSRGLSSGQVDVLHGLPEKATERALYRLKKKYERTGRDWPITPLSIRAVLSSSAVPGTYEQERVAA